MGEKKSNWLEHLKAAEASGQKLSGYAAHHQIDVRRLYEAKRKRSLQGASSWAVVRVKAGPTGQVTPRAWGVRGANRRCHASATGQRRCLELDSRSAQRGCAMQRAAHPGGAAMFRLSANLAVYLHRGRTIDWRLAPAPGACPRPTGCPASPGRHGHGPGRSCRW